MKRTFLVTIDHSGVWAKVTLTVDGARRAVKREIAKLFPGAKIIGFVNVNKQ